MQALEIREVHKTFGSTRVLAGCSLAVRRGERLAVIGPNGAGKSTLFDLVSGGVPCSGGEIHLNGRRIDRLPPYERQRLGLGRSFQVSRVFKRLSVLDNLRCAATAAPAGGVWRLLGRDGTADDYAESLLVPLALHARRHLLASQLSYADQRALELGIALAARPSVVLLDEPTAGMSRSETERFTALIRELTANVTLLMIEHDMSVVFDLADRVAVLDAGEIIALGSPAAVRADQRVRAAYLGELDDGLDKGLDDCLHTGPENA